MTDRELMQQALEALIWTTGSDDFGDGGKAREGALKLLFPSIAALRERLAQPQRTHWEGCEEVHPECKKPEQKSVKESSVTHSHLWIGDLYGKEKNT